MAVRIFGSISEHLMEQVNVAASEQNVSRSQWLSNAIEAYLEHGDVANFDASIAELQQLRSENEQYKSMMKQSDQQIAFLQSHIGQLTQSINQLALEKKDDQISQLTQSISQLVLERKEEVPSKRSWWKFWQAMPTKS